MNDFQIKTSELFDCNVEFLKDFFDSHEYPWEMVSDIGALIEKFLCEGIEGYSLLREGILVGKGVKISPMSEICAPTVIGHGTEIRIGAYIRGNAVVGENCVIGNSCEVKNSILLNGVQIPHYNYVGDSVLGNKSHLGAGAICSNLKNDKSNVVVHGEVDYPTGLRKLGAILGDGVNVGCGCVLNPGTVIGKNTSVYPLQALRGIIPSCKIIKSQSI